MKTQTSLYCRNKTKAIRPTRRRDFHAEARKRRIPVLSYLSVHSKDMARDAESLVPGTDPWTDSGSGTEWAPGGYAPEMKLYRNLTLFLGGYDGRNVQDMRQWSHKGNEIQITDTGWEPDQNVWFSEKTRSTSGRCAGQILGLLAGLTGGDRVSGGRDELAKHLL